MKIIEEIKYYLGQAGLVFLMGLAILAIIIFVIPLILIPIVVIVGCIKLLIWLL